MAGDTRDPPSDSQSGKSSSLSSSFHSSSSDSKKYIDFSTAANEQAPARYQVPNAVEAAKLIKLEEFKEVHKKPCVRDALLTGIVGGFGVGGIRAILGGWCIVISSFC
jgi:hypothetical protein